MIMFRMMSHILKQLFNISRHLIQHYIMIIRHLILQLHHHMIIRHLILRTVNHITTVTATHSTIQGCIQSIHHFLTTTRPTSHLYQRILRHAVHLPHPPQVPPPHPLQRKKASNVVCGHSYQRNLISSVQVDFGA